MTKQQIEWANTRETIRHNKEMEAQGKASISETERHQQAMDVETARHNVAYEDITQKHNLATEQEANRSNLANEYLKSQSNTIQLEHNLATEEQARNELAETTRSHKEQETQKQLQFAEDYRHNVAVEQETRRSNKAKEAETQRHNEASEDVESYKAGGQMLLNLSQVNYYDARAKHETVSANYTQKELDWYDAQVYRQFGDSVSKYLDTTTKAFDSINKAVTQYNSTLNQY